MIEKIVSGGQTGADRAGLDAAIACGVPHGGWCPKGRKAEDGTIPERYQLTETQGASYLARTERNVKRSDGTVIFTVGELAGGSLRTVDFARRHRKPWIHIRLGEVADEQAVNDLRQFIKAHRIKLINVAGSSESRESGLYQRVRSVVCLVLHSK